MANKPSIEEQVAVLTAEQKQMILKVDKIATIAIMIVGIPGILLSLLGLFVIITDPLSVTEQFMFGFSTIVAVVLLWVVGVFAFVKIKYPYYSDKKVKYIKKQQKEKK